MDQSTVELGKLYNILNENTENPAETFTFKIEKAGVEQSQLTYETMPTFGSSSILVAFDKGEASEPAPDNLMKYATLSLPQYDYVGIYKYRITEVQGTTAGVDYNKNSLILTVTVINCPENEGQLDRICTLKLDDETGTKVSHVTNLYSAGSLSVEKTVTGILGDKSKEFNMTVDFTAPEGKTVNSDIKYVYNGALVTLGPDDWTDGKASVKVTLSHGESVAFANIPYGVTYTVTEAEANTDGYETSYVYNDTGEKNVIDSADESVEIINDKGGDVPTGLAGGKMLYSGAAVVIALLAAALIAVRRKKA